MTTGTETPSRSQLLQDVDAVHVRQVVVQQQHIVASPPQQRQALASRCDDVDLEVWRVLRECVFVRSASSALSSA